MIRMTDILLNEAGKENRIIPTRLVAILEKCMGDLKAADQKQITELLSRVLEGITKVNEMPYNYNTMTAWQMTQLAEVEAPVILLREKLNKLLTTKSSKINIETVRQAIGALDELYVY